MRIDFPDAEKRPGETMQAALAIAAEASDAELDRLVIFAASLLYAVKTERARRAGKKAA
jgi:hypothetical protein